MKKYKLNIFLLVAFVFFASIFLLNWSLYIVDQDDPFTIAYHFWGRNEVIQTVYQPYDSMCDYMLSFLPRNYPILYYSMLVWTFLSGCVIYIMFIRIASSFTSIAIERLYLYGFVMLLAIPGFNYLFLSYKSSLIGFAFIITSHYILISDFRNKHELKITSLFLSALLFGLGAVCRWNLVVYGITIVTDIIYLQHEKLKWKQWSKILIWVVVAILFFMLFLYISGYDVSSFIRVIKWGKGYIKESNFQLVYILADCIAMFTPVTIICLSIGIIKIVKNYRSNTRVLLIIIASWVPFMYLGVGENIKYLLTFFPALFIVFIIGAEYIHRTLLQLNKFFKWLFLLLLLMPWFVGVWIYSDTTMWGPGFNLKEKTTTNKYEKNLDKRFKIDRLRIKFDAGFAISSAEATIPLWGHFYALFSGRLVQFDKKISDEADTVIAIAAHEHTNIFSDFPGKFPPMLLNSLCKYGYYTNDSCMQKGLSTTRSFYKEYKKVTIKVFNNDKNVEDFERLKKLISTKRFIAYFTYSSLLADFINKAPAHNITIIRQIGPFSCLFEIK